MKIFSELGTCANRFLVPENPQVPKSQNKNWSQNKKVEKIDFLIWGTLPPIGGHKNFLELSSIANRFLVPENSQVPKISQFGEKIF
jgi:hypothetical protein